jgi:hypothetical protein
MRKDGISNHQMYEWYLYKDLNQFICATDLVRPNMGINLQEKKISKTPTMLIIAVTRMIFSTKGDSKKDIISL